MPFEQSWLVQNAVILVKYEDDVTIDEVTESVEELVWRMNTTQRQLVHMVMDMTALGTHPTNLSELNNIAKMLLSHERVGWLLMLGNQNSLTKFLVEMIAQMSKIRFRGFVDWEETREFLQGMDSTLPELPEEI